MSRRARIDSGLPGAGPGTRAWWRREGVRAAGFDESDFRKDMEARTPLGRIGPPEDIAPAVVFLAAEDSAWITGESLLIAGGLR